MWLACSAAAATATACFSTCSCPVALDRGDVPAPFDIPRFMNLSLCRLCTNGLHAVVLPSLLHSHFPPNYPTFYHFISISLQFILFTSGASRSNVFQTSAGWIGIRPAHDAATSRLHGGVNQRVIMLNTLRRHSSSPPSATLLHPLVPMRTNGRSPTSTACSLSQFHMFQSPLSTPPSLSSVVLTVP